MKKIQLISGNKQSLLSKPPTLVPIYQKQKNKSPSHLNQQKSTIRQTPQFNETQSPIHPVSKQSKVPKKLNTLHSRASVTSITFQDNTGNNDYSEMESPVRRGVENDSIRPVNTNYLSLISLPDQFNLRPSQTSIKRFKFQTSKYSFHSSGSDKCESCQYEGEMENLYKLGWVAWSWIIFLFLSTIILFFLPLFLRSFQKKELICPQCGSKVRTQNPTCL